MENDVIRKLMEDYKWKEEGFTVGYGGNVLSKKEEWGEPNGFQIDKKNCEFKWFARKGENERIFKLKTPEQYTRAITELIKACQDKELPCYEYSSASNYQSGLRITIIDETNGSQTDDEKADAVNEWKKKHLKEFLELKENVLKKIKEEAPMSQEEQMNEIKELLVNNHNIILHGAPGTGKTYLAKEIATKMMDCTENEIGFVQFHQSFDYTDFVEGLRPCQKEDSQDIAFEPKDGIFKKFCAKALKNLVESNKDKETYEKESSWQEECKDFFKGIEDSEDSDDNNHIKNNFETKITKNPFVIDSVDEESVTVSIPNNSKRNVLNFKIRDLIKVLVAGNPKKVQNIREALNRKGHRQIDSYMFALAKAIYEFKSGKQENDKSTDIQQEKKNYVFIIDEINRGEMSKIFGELFYSIDPGYRVKYEDLKKHKEGSEKLTTIQTQYANLQKDANDFDIELGISDDEKDNHGHFFVPENVYIIGTMNDIDRSVESMDFAMRRRFAFKEITAGQSKTMLDKPDSWKNGNGEKIDVSLCLENIKNRMDNLNNAILNKEFNLGQAYQIGGAYFLKFANYCETNGNKVEGEQKDAFDSLWKNHLEGVLREYLRGMDNVEGEDGKLEKLKDAYDFKVIYKDDGTIDTNAKNGKPSAEAKGDHVDGKDKQTEERDA